MQGGSAASQTQGEGQAGRLTLVGRTIARMTAARSLRMPTGSAISRASLLCRPARVIGPCSL